MSTPKSIGFDQTIQSSSRFRNARKIGRRIASMVQNVLLIWLDANIDENDSRCRKSLNDLRAAVNTIQTFTDCEECIHFLEDVADEKVCMIISGEICQQIVPVVQNMPQVNSIFILSANRKYHEEWSKNCAKIKGVFAEIDSICQALRPIAQQCERNTISISIISAGDDGAVNKSGNQLDPSFTYTQIMKEILLTIDFEQKHFNEFIQHCHEVFADNKKQLECVDKFARKYNQYTPIWWYSCDCFLYPMLNRALRTMDADLMVKMGFFISDLYRHIEQLHQEQFGDDNSKQCFTVYRGQGLNKEDFTKMVANKGGLLSFNNFLSTSKDRLTSFAFGESVLADPQLMGVLFVININPAQFNTSFASVADVGYFGEQEDEVLFSMHTVFRIGEITLFDDNTRLVEVQLNLASDKDNDLRQLIDHIRKETDPNSVGWYRLGLVLWKMGESAMAQEMFKILLDQETKENADPTIHSHLGLMKCELGEYEESIAYYKKSIEIEEKRIPRRDLNLAASYSNMGSSYNCMGDYPHALSSYERALEIKQQSLPSNHLDLATTYNNIGLVCDRMGDYPRAISSHENALAIRQQSLPPTHPDLAASYNNTGLLYDSMGNYPKALLSHEKALAIRQQSLPSVHPDLATSYNNIGLVYYSMGDYQKALVYLEKALTIRQKSLPSTHPDLATSYDSIGSVYDSLSDYPQALSSYGKALAIRQQSLPPTHPDLAASHNNIGGVYYSIGDYSQALSSYKKALEIKQKSLSPTHPDLATSYNNIGLVYDRMSDYPQALSSHENALAIRQQSLPVTHPDLAASYNNIGSVYDSMGNYSQALLSYKKALRIKQKSLPPTHPNLATSFNNIGLVYYSMSDYSKALSSFKNALTIQQKSLPPNHPDLAMPYNNFGLVYSSIGDYPQALSYYEKALEIKEQSLPPNHPDLAMTYNNEGLLHENMGNRSKAHSYFERAVDIAQRSLAENHPHLQKYRNNLSRVKNS